MSISFPWQHGLFRLYFIGTVVKSWYNICNIFYFYKYNKCQGCFSFNTEESFFLIRPLGYVHTVYLWLKDMACNTQEKYPSISAAHYTFYWWILMSFWKQISPIHWGLFTSCLPTHFHHWIHVERKWEYAPFRHRCFFFFTCRFMRYKKKRVHVNYWCTKACLSAWIYNGESIVIATNATITHSFCCLMCNLVHFFMRNAKKCLKKHESNV